MVSRSVAARLVLLHPLLVRPTDAISIRVPTVQVAPAVMVAAAAAAIPKLTALTDTRFAGHAAKAALKRIASK